MEGLVWLLPAAEATHLDPLGELYDSILRTLSQRIPVWGLAWNPHFPVSKKTYALTAWNAHGRFIGFRGAWPTKALQKEVEQLWRWENFQPRWLLLGRARWMLALGRRWRRQYALTLLPPLPLSEAQPLYLPYSGLPMERSETTRQVTLLVSPSQVEEAAFLAELLALSQWQVYVVGTPAPITPLRQAANRFRHRLHLWVGPSWLEAELALAASWACITLSRQPTEEVLVRLGAPWVCPKAHPLAAYAQAVYTHPTELPRILPTLTPPPALTPERFVQNLLSHLKISSPA
ncbi:MAG: hypothetical protein NZ958_06940 [Bacteroidia bacterium]|nr:hypothetical protein [Bacteroidia bacterium]MDW8089434.1 hypothetical protein [Bacteroidia bacterium]